MPLLEEQFWLPTLTVLFFPCDIVVIPCFASSLYLQLEVVLRMVVPYFLRELSTDHFPPPAPESAVYSPPPLERRGRQRQRQPDFLPFERQHPCLHFIMSHHTTSRSSKRQPGLTAKLHTRHFVVHDYHDYSTHTADMVQAPPAKPRRGGVTTPFPQKLHEFLDQVERDGYAHVISWQPHGRCFVIHKPKEFEASVMPR